MATHHPAAVRAWRKWLTYPEANFAEHVTTEYTPFVEAARKLCRRSTVDIEQSTQTFVFTADLETLRAVLRDTIGEP